MTVDSGKHNLFFSPNLATPSAFQHKAQILFEQL